MKLFAALFFLVPLFVGAINEGYAQSETKVAAGDTTASARFGFDVALTDSFAIVGAYLDKERGTDAGAAYIYKGAGEAWQQVAKLTAGDASNGDLFGYSVSISGEWAIVGAFNDDDDGTDSGSAYVFRYDGAGWPQVAKLTASGAAREDRFGISVSVSGDRIVVGATGEDLFGGLIDAGAAYVFEWNGLAWQQVAELTASDAAPGDAFGAAVAVAGESIVVGATGEDDKGSGAGAAYVFSRINGSWQEVAKLSADDGAANDDFGKAVAISENRAVIGSPADDDNGGSSGSAYAFEKLSNGAWTQIQKLTASDGASNDNFGSSVSISEHRVMVGAYLDNTSAGANAGAAYLFSWNGMHWRQTQRLVPSDGVANDRFGRSVSVWQDQAIIGAYEDHVGGKANAGSAYIYAFMPVAPGLLAPTDGASRVTLTPEFSWHPVADATSYGFQLSVDSDFRAPLVAFDNLATPTFNISADLLQPGTTYYWRANATNTAGTGAWSATWAFTTAPDSVCPWDPIKTSTAGLFQGQAVLTGAVPSIGSCVAAFDENGHLAGANDLVHAEGAAFINLAIYGDDPTTPGTDEGLNTGEAFLLKLYEAATGTVYHYTGTFDGWQDTNGAPMPGYDDPTVVYDFATTNQALSLATNWNLVSFIVQPEDPAPGSLLAPLEDRLVFATGFDCQIGAQFYDPEGLDFLNTLEEMRAGHGYWLKLSTADTLRLEDLPQPADRSVDLCAGWNLIGYWPAAAMTPDAAFAALIEAGQLVYVTSFTPDAGALFYDPSGPDFLNTLTMIEPNRGYWLKLNTAVDGFQYPEIGLPLAAAPVISSQQKTRGYTSPAIRSPAEAGIHLTNRYMFIQGTVRFEEGVAPVGTYLEILTGAGLKVGEAQILEGGWLKTTAVYGDDLTTPEVDGAVDREALFFRHGDVVLKAGLVFTPDLALHRIAPVFKVADADPVPTAWVLEPNYPNPFNPTTTIRYGMPAEAHVRLEVYNAMGQRVAVLVDEVVPVGWHTTVFDGSGWASGVYVYRLRAGASQLTQTMLLLK